MSGLSNSEKDKLYLPIFVCGAILLVITVYWFGYAFFRAFGLTIPFIDEVLLRVRGSGALQTPYGCKGLILLLVVLNTIVRSGSPTKMEWSSILLRLGLGLLLFLFPFRHAVPFIVCTVAGYLLLINAIALLGRKIKAMGGPENDVYETFDQCREKIETEYSINIPTKFQWKHKKHRGWINVVNPFRATMVLGTPGSGKSFSVYNPFISQMMAKGYTCFLYDYKFPDLTEEIYNEYLLNQDNFRKKMKGKVPKFCVINFDDPRYSMRCNPISPRYITDPADTSEIADIIMRNVNPQSVEKEDFFTLSAKVYIDALIWFLRIFQDGRYCTFPHLIELMGRNYEAVFRMLQKYDDIRVKIQPFQNALQGKAQEQLQGQIASAQIPLLRFASPALYWVLSGDDFTLDVNDKEDPKIVCIGNNPDRQTIYGTTLALYTSRMFRQINHKGKYPCGVLLDELPTIYIKGIDNLIATARSNKVAIVLGAQDESQLRRDYGDKESEVVFNTVGNIFAGQVNGKTAKTLSETFGREFREQQSETTGDSVSVNRSFQQQEILPQSRIETLTQGYFFGKVADNNDCRIDKKLFCGEIQIDMEERKRKDANRKKIPQMQSDYFDDAAIEKDIRDHKDIYIREYVTEVLRKEEREKLYANENYTAYTPDSEEETREIDSRVESLKSKDLEKLLKEIIKKKQREAVDEILKENYNKIKNDILLIFKANGIEEYPDKKDEPAGDGLGDDNKPGGDSEIEDPTQSNPMYPAGGAGAPPPEVAAAFGSSSSGDGEETPSISSDLDINNIDIDED